MPRTSVSHTSQVPRARNRINNKSRLRVVFGVTIDGEVLGEESTQNQSYGVDAEDSTVSKHLIYDRRNATGSPTCPC